MGIASKSGNNRLVPIIADRPNEIIAISNKLKCLLLSTKLTTATESAAQGVLDARSAHPESSLADLYDPVTMPPDLTKAHQKLDAAVDAAYFAAHDADSAKKTWRNDAKRVAFLFTLYQRFTSFLPLAIGASSGRKTSKKQSV